MRCQHRLSGACKNTLDNRICAASDKVRLIRTHIGAADNNPTLRHVHVTETLIGEQARSVPWLPSVPFAKIAIGICYVATFILFDWIAYSPSPLRWIAPWHPGIGLSFALLLLFDWRFLPLIVLTYFVSEITVRGFELPLALSEAGIAGAGAGIFALLLLHSRLRINLALQSLRDLFILMSVAAVGMALIDAAYLLLLMKANFIEPHNLTVAFVSKWLGDIISIFVITPAVLAHVHREEPPKPTIETMVQMAAFVIALVIAVITFRRGLFGYYPLLFLPVIWVAIRCGIVGASAGVLFIELGLFVIVRMEPQYHPDIIQLQTRLATLAITGLVAGMLVSERQNAEIRRYQDALGRLGRLGSTGEFAGMLAHEINQPLTAAGTYARLVAEKLEAGIGDKTQIIDAAYKTIGQVERAAEVMRRLRALSKTGRVETAPVNMERVAQETLQILNPDIQRNDIVVETKIGRDVPQVMADELQIEQVLFNLIRNAIEALRDGPTGGGKVTIEIDRGEIGFAEIRICDTGPGFPSDFLRSETSLLFTTKPDGFGIGLSLCKSIIAAHGGRLWFGGSSQGAIVYFTLPSVETNRNG